PRLARVGRGREQDVGTGGPDLHDRLLEPGGEDVQVDRGAQDVVAAADHRDQVGFHGQRLLQLRTDDVAELAAPDGEVGIPELASLLRRPAGEVLGQPVRPAPEPGRVGGIGVDHALGERVADGDVALPDSWLVGGDRHGRLQSMGSAPRRRRWSLARLNGREPKNPEWADSGDGWADSMQGMPWSRPTRVRASRPQRMATSGPPRWARASIAAAV